MGVKVLIDYAGVGHLLFAVLVLAAPNRFRVRSV